VFCAAPYVLAINSVGAGDETITLAGPVLDKWRRSGKTTSYSVQILDDRTQRTVRMRVSPADYRAIEVGARFSREYLVGRLGIPYRWTIR
jgi:hypothetical protein